MRRLMAAVATALLALTVVGAVPASATPPWPEVFDPAILRTLDLQMTTQDWDFIRKDLTETYKPGYLSTDGEAPILVGIRRKSSRALPSESNPIKVGLKVDINEYVSGQMWHGLNKLSLENGADSGVLEEGLAWAMHRMAGVPANQQYPVAFANFVRVNMNGLYIGVYVNAEQRDKQALRNRGLWQGGSTWLYEQDQSTLLLEEGDPDSPAVQALCFAPFKLASKGKNTGLCATPSDAQLEATLSYWLDMDAFLTHCAVEALTGNTDGMCAKGHNAFFVDFSVERLEGSGLKRFYMPWDLDTVFGSTSNTNIYGAKSGRRLVQGPYESLILNDAAFRAQYNGKIVALMDGPLSQSTMEAFLDQLQAVLGPALAADPYPTSGASSFSRLKTWLVARYSSARSQAENNTNPAPRPAST